ncbi:fimbrial protein [Serratia aquatilis]|uniref:Fimbrial protein n=1 Tax=Serratia aquatilis TaxID=1737515 RepID=A0ABV6EEW1_9GAMM
MRIASILRKTAVLVLFCCVVSVQAASNGVLNVTGSIKSATCYFDSVEGQDNKTYDWTLPQVYTGNLDRAGKTSGRKKSSIFLGGVHCTNGYTPYITLHNGATVSAQTGNLVNTLSDEADNVQIRLLMNDTPLDLRGSPRVGCAVIVNRQSQCDIEYEYYATGAATSGKVKSTIQFDISYD